MASWDDVMYVLALHRHGSLSAAARSLGVNQTTVGRRVKALERDVGATLLRTTATGIVLTDAGRDILPEAERMEATMASLERKVHGKDARVSGVVKIATTEALASTFLIPRLVHLRARHPELELVIMTSNTPVNLARGDADLAVRLVKSTDTALISRRVGEIRLGAFAAKAYLAKKPAVSFATKLRGHDVLGYHGDLANGTEARWLAQHASAANLVVRVNSVLNLLAATVAGLGIAVLPVGLGDELVKLAIPDEPESRGVWVVYPQDARNNARVKAVTSDLVAITRDPKHFPRAR
ncbi:MAG: LysR family transcriptional regulator [Kofleriaceae bacterium]